MKDHLESPVHDFKLASADLVGQNHSAMSNFEKSGHDRGAFSLVLGDETVLTGLRSAFQSGQLLSGISVETVAGDVDGLMASGHAGVEEVQVPLNPIARQKFLAEWSAKNGKLKGAKYALLMLPLAACGGGGDGVVSSSGSGSSREWLLCGHAVFQNY